MDKNMTNIINQSFTQYAGAVLQSRALVDVRDCMKPSARQIFYSMWRNKYIHSKPYEKTNAPMGDAMKEFYIHGDASCVGIMMRAAQNFAMRVPICEVEGNCGTLINSGNWASERYTSTRLAEIANYLFADIEKETIDDWRDNYADNLQYPAVLPSKGYYNLVNGSAGIAIGMSASLPSFNLREMNEMLIRLLNNPDLPAEEAVILPDFPTGAILLNKREVVESLLNGRGKACKLRSVVSFDSKERCFIVSEIPYGTYTNTICGQLDEILESEDNPGVERFNDLTGKTPLIKIYLTKNANSDKVLKFLYKNTSLQSYYAINMTMLDKGKYPKVFSLKEAMMEFLKHQEDVYRRGFEFDLRKINARLHILEALFKAYDAIDEVISTIKKSASTAAANAALQKLLSIDEVQAKAILDLKLSRLSRLDISKLREEKSNLVKEKSRIEAILNDEALLKKEIEKGLREVAEKFGDARRTQILNLEEAEEGEIVEKKRLSVSFTNKGRIFSNEISTLYTQKRGSVGTRLKLEKGEYIVENVVGDSTELVLLFTSDGLCRKMTLGDFKIGEKNYLQLDEGEQLCAATLMAYKDYVLFATRNGMVKKTLLSNFSVGRNSTVKSLTLTKGDALISVCFLNKERIGILTKGGNFVIIKSEDVREVGRVAQGVKGITLKEGDEVVSVRAIPDSTVEILSATSNGDAKRTSITEYGVQGRATKGLKIQNGAQFGDFYPLTNESEILANGTATQLCLSISDITLSGRATQGVRLMKLKPNEKFLRFSSI
jgi:DNA gyrase subunit A